jgi:deoxyribodipyrimidine photo-lyase
VYRIQSRRAISKEVTAEEVAVETALQSAVKPLGIALKSFWGHTLYHPDDLPFAIHQLPELFTNFRKQVEKSANVNPTFYSTKAVTASA